MCYRLQYDNHHKNEVFDRVKGNAYIKNRKKIDKKGKSTFFLSVIIWMVLKGEVHANKIK